VAVKVVEDARALLLAADGEPLEVAAAAAAQLPQGSLRGRQVVRVLDHRVVHATTRLSFDSNACVLRSEGAADLQAWFLLDFCDRGSILVSTVQTYEDFL
jgi:hypothetical protein